MPHITELVGEWSIVFKLFQPVKENFIEKFLHLDHFTMDFLNSSHLWYSLMKNKNTMSIVLYFVLFCFKSGQEQYFIVDVTSREKFVPYVTLSICS